MARAGDYATVGKGKLYLDPSGPNQDNNIVKGKGTAFTSQLNLRYQIQLGKAYGFATVEVTEIIDDETVQVKKLFSKDKAIDDLKAEGNKVTKGQDGGLSYKFMPYIDQTQVSTSVKNTLTCPCNVILTNVAPPTTDVFSSI